MQDLNIQAGKFIKATREIKGMTPEQLSKKAFGQRASRGRINEIEHGKPISLNTLGKILDALDSKIEFKESTH